MSVEWPSFETTKRTTQAHAKKAFDVSKNVLSTVLTADAIHNVWGKFQKNDQDEKLEKLQSGIEHMQTELKHMKENYEHLKQQQQQSKQQQVPSPITSPLMKKRIESFPGFSTRNIRAEMDDHQSDDEEEEEEEEKEI